MKLNSCLLTFCLNHLKPSGYFTHNTRFNNEISTLCSRSALLCWHILVSQNKHRLFPWSALTNWVLQPRYWVFTVRYNLSIYTLFRIILFFTVLKMQWPIIKLSLHKYNKHYMKVTTQQTTEFS